MADDWSEKSVPWGRLEGAYGSAAEVGELLSLIESGEDVWSDLINEVLHQRSLYDATAPAISWVVRFLGRGGLAEGPQPARGTARRMQTVSQKTWAFSFLSAAAASATQSRGCSPERASDALTALREGASLYEAGLTDRDAGVRLASAAIWKAVATGRVDRTRACASIADQYERETESEVRVTMLSALDTLAEDGTRWRDRLLSILKSAASDGERFYAAAYLASRLGRSTPGPIAGQLAQSYAGLEEAGYPVELTNLEEPDDLLWSAVQAMTRHLGVACLARALKLSRDDDPYKTIGIVERLLRLASNDKRNGWGGTTSSRGPKIEHFGVKPSRRRAWLRSPEARTALSAIVNKAGVWRIETNLPSLFGLPGGREELRRMLRTTAAVAPREAGKRLAALGGTQPALTRVRRRHPKPQ
jgi:hypothetical protein